jgi:Trypsin/Tachylectin
LPVLRTRRWVAALAGTVVAAGLVGGGSAGAVAGAEPVPDGTYGFTAKITFGDVHACTGALVDKYWVVTAKNCFADGAAPVAPGAPARPSTAVVGRTNLTGTAGHEVPIVTVIPHPDRNLALARLSVPVTDIAPVALATSAPAAAETLTVAGYGRTTTEWIPDRLHAATFTVQGVAASAVDLVGATAGAGICKGDAGGPALRTVAGAAQLVALNNTSWQKGCLGETPTSDGATATRLDDLGAWVREQMADVQIFGILSDGRLTYDVIDSASGDLRASRRSTATLGFTPQVMATLNANTILVTNTSGVLYRVDITNLNPLTFTPVQIGTRWGGISQLVYDGYGSLYALFPDTNLLRRYTVTSNKPASLNEVTRNIQIGTGFVFKSMTSPGAGRILGNRADGRLLSYKTNGTGPTEAWTVSELATTGWGAPTHLLSPGGGYYYARNSTGRMDRYRDLNPFDGKATDIQSFPTDPVSTSGWDQVLLSARPWTGLVSVYGTRPDGRLSYTALDPVTGATKIRTVSTQTLGFTPKAMATLNSDTLLVTNTADQLFRVDITSTQPLTFTRTANNIGTGWVHDRMVYDGFGSLFGQPGTALIRYTVTKPKPTAWGTDIINRTEIFERGLVSPTLAATGKGHLLGTVNGALAAYTATGAGAWSRADIATSGWSGYTSLFSPGGGLYYRRNASGVVTGFLDTSPFDGSGADLTAYAPTGTASGGWDPILSAQPYDAWPDNLRSAW